MAKDAELEARITSMTNAVTEMQSAYLSTVQKMAEVSDRRKESNWDKTFKLLQIVLPLLLAFGAFYVSSRISPIEIAIVQTKEEQRDMKRRIDLVEMKQQESAVTEGKRDVILQQLQKDMAELKELVKSMNKHSFQEAK